MNIVFYLLTGLLLIAGAKIFFLQRSLRAQSINNLKNEDLSEDKRSDLEIEQLQKEINDADRARQDALAALLHADDKPPSDGR